MKAKQNKEPKALVNHENATTHKRFKWSNMSRTKLNQRLAISHQSMKVLKLSQPKINYEFHSLNS